MKDELRARLDKTFDKDAAAKAKKAEEKTLAEQENEKFIANFNTIRDDIICPAMNEFGQYLKEKGYKSKITSQDGEAVSFGSPREPSIRISFFTGDLTKETSEYPGLKVTCATRDKNVRFHESTMSPTGGGSSGPAGTAALHKITADLIQEKLGELVARYLGK